jgi:hypothetical protein
MAKRTLSVTRIFPLGQYKNIQLTNAVEVGDDSNLDVAETYRKLTKEIYLMFFEHAGLIEKTEAVKSFTEKAEVFKHESERILEE